MSPIRPTLNLLEKLKGDFSSSDISQILAERSYTALPPLGSLSSLHPALRCCADDFNYQGDKVTTHSSASKAAKQKVYEIRDKSLGPAWRTAVVEIDGVRWAVYAERHDVFHRNVASAFEHLDLLSPTKTDLALLKYQTANFTELAESREAWELTFVDLLRSAMNKAVHNEGEEFSFEVGGYPAASNFDPQEVKEQISDQRNTNEEWRPLSFSLLASLETDHDNEQGSGIVQWVEFELCINEPWNLTGKEPVSTSRETIDSVPTEFSSLLGARIHYLALSTLNGQDTEHVLVGLHRRIASGAIVIGVRLPLAVVKSFFEIPIEEFYKPFKVAEDDYVTVSCVSSSHYVKKSAIQPAVANESVVLSICGIWFEPTKFPEDYDVCDLCKAAYEDLE